MDFLNKPHSAAEVSTSPKTGSGPFYKMLKLKKPRVPFVNGEFLA